MEWTNQLIFQFDARTLKDFDELSVLELAIDKGLPKGAKLDGHDCGRGEYNVFIHTSDPVAIFEAISEVIGRQCPEIVFRAAYRSFNQDEYTILWPTSLTKFAVS